MTLQKRVAILERSAAQHDKQIKAIRDLVQIGMRMMVETRKDLRALAAGVRELTNSLKRGPDGHARRKVDFRIVVAIEKRL
jgi:uncharacterized coiled-coil protein SlyX